MIHEPDLQAKYAAIFPRLPERQRRLIAAADALCLGRGGVSQVARASKLSRTTIHRGIAELDTRAQGDTRLRHAGRGRKRVVEHNPALLTALEALVEPVTRGDPMSPSRWTCKRTRQLAAALGQHGYTLSPPTVATLLYALGSRLQANAKTREGASHPDRDRQFRDLNASVTRSLPQPAPRDLR